MRIRDPPTRESIKKDKLDNVYYNLTIRALEKPVLAEFFETRQDIILDDPNDYYMTIARFTVPLNSLPIFIFKIEEGITQNNVDRGTYAVSLVHNASGDIFTENLQYINEGVFPVPVPPSQNNGKQLITEYYYVYSYQHMINMINTALATAFTALQTAHPTIYSSNPPFFYYDENSELISLVAQKTYDTDGFFINVSPGPIQTLFPQEIKIYSNTSLLTLLDGFDVFFEGFNNSPLIASFNIRSSPFNRNVYFPLNVSPTDLLINPINDLAPTAFISATQEYTTLVFWNSFRNLLFVTNTIPIKNEYLPTINSINNPIGGEGINNFFPILTDFEPLLERAGNTRGLLNYTAEGQYRLTDMQSNLPLRKFDIKLFWVDQDNNLYPMTIFPFTQVKIKFLFVRKELYNYCVDC